SQTERFLRLRGAVHGPQEASEAAVAVGQEMPGGSGVGEVRRNPFKNGYGLAESGFRGRAASRSLFLDKGPTAELVTALPSTPPRRPKIRQHPVQPDRWPAVQVLKLVGRARVARQEIGQVHAEPGQFNARLRVGGKFVRQLLEGLDSPALKDLR